MSSTAELTGHAIVPTATLTTSNELFRLLVTSVTDYAIVILDLGGFVTTWNAGAERFTGYAAAEIIGRHFSVLYPDVDVRAGKCERELEVAARDGRFEDEGWRVRKDGTRFWANVIITPLRDESGTLIGFGKVTHDLTQRRLADAERFAADERFRRLIDSVQDYAICLLDPNGNVATWNAGAERITGYRADEIIGAHLSRFYPDRDIAADKCSLALDAAVNEGHVEDEGWRLRKDGSTFWATVVISSIRDDLGKLTGFSKITRDLTERKRSEDETTARIAAENANRTKDEFLAMLGHELRNPLAPIVSAIQLLKLRGDVKSVREHQIIERQVNQMTRLVDDLLDVSRISRGKISLQKETFDLRDALAKATEMAIPQFELKQQVFLVDIAQRPMLVDGDESRLVQVFANLLNNASRYTPSGGHIEVSVRDVEREILVEVRDDGIGIEPTLLPRIFDLFIQGYQEADRSEGGLGLGLTLVRSIVELHDGHVEASSRGRDHGSTFSVRLPSVEGTTTVEPPTRTTSNPSSKTARSILVVDDNEDARVLLVEMLGTLGHHVEAAADGGAALEILQTFTPDIALLDIGLPGMDGHELARRIRTSKGNDIRLVALSGYAQDTDRRRGESAGFDAHLSKPVGLHRIIEEIAASTQHSRP